MKLLKSISELATLQRPLVLVPGTFDGVHRGHQALICRAKEEAVHCGGSVVVMTFDQHPAALLRPDKAPLLLTSTRQKLRLLESYGVEAVLLLAFDKKLAALSAEKFITELAAPENFLKTICVGQQWFFGQGGKGNVELLRLFGDQFGFNMISMDPVKVDDVPVSSTRLRQLIAAGHLVEAGECLDRCYALAGTIIKGAGLGKKLGFPTANIFIDKAQLPPFGVYVTRAHLKGKVFFGVANIGIRPTVEATLVPTVEVHLFNLVDDLYEEQIELELISYLREEKSFSNLEELKEQIARDVEIAKDKLH